MAIKASHIITLLLPLLGISSIGGCEPIKAQVQFSNSNSVNPKREAEVLEILNNNLSWSFGKGTSLYRWPTDKDAKNAFSYLTDGDIPILIKVIQKNEIGDGQVNLAVWVLSIFGDKAKIQITKAYELALSADEKERWKTLLDFIESNNGK